MNIAKRIIARYESTDFKDDYYQLLSEAFHYNKDIVVERILTLFNVQNYETQESLANWRVISRKEATEIHSLISENFDNFVSDFKGYYVGYTSLESVEFSEQEEQLEGLYNYKTDKNYGMKYLKKVFYSEGFFVSDNCAYYNLSGGLHIDLLNDVELINNFLN